jgi:hypothetical protein
VSCTAKSVFINEKIKKNKTKDDKTNKIDKTKNKK